VKPICNGFKNDEESTMPALTSSTALQGNRVRNSLAMPLFWRVRNGVWMGIHRV
jgi:hypothetical protein